MNNLSKYANEKFIQASFLYQNKNYRESCICFQLAAEDGHPEAMFCLGAMYETGTGVNKEINVAFRWYRQAAEHGHPLAMYCVAMMLLGNGVEANIPERNKWLHLAAENGVAAAQFDIGAMYGNGIGYEKNHSKAVMWYRKSAQQGYDKGQFSLGVMYYNGMGVEQDYDEAEKWFLEAARQGHNGAIDILLSNYDYDANDLDSNYFDLDIKYRNISDYFLKHPFGTEPPVMTLLSTLPPQDRCIILEYLRKTQPNIHVYDKLAMAYLKNGKEDKGREILEEGLIVGEYDFHKYSDLLAKLTQLSKHIAQNRSKSSASYGATIQILAVEFSNSRNGQSREFYNLLLDLCHSN